MVYAIIFIIGYLGGFKYMNIVLNHYIEYSDYIMYALIFFLSIGIFYPFLREGFKTFDKEILNEISTVFVFFIAFTFHNTVHEFIIISFCNHLEWHPFVIIIMFRIRLIIYLICKWHCLRLLHLLLRLLICLCLWYCSVV